MSDALSRRERQIMDVLHERGPSTAAEVRERLPEAPSYSTTRALLRILEDKGHVSHAEDGPRYVFRPKASLQKARQQALRRFLKTFCNDSPEELVAALIAERSPDAEALQRLQRIITQAKKEGR